MSELKIVVVTPERTAIDETAEFVSLPIFDGEMGVGIGHSPFIAQLGYGEIRWRTANETTRFFIDAGFVQVQGDSVVVLTENVIPIDEIDRSAAQEQLEKVGQRRDTSDAEFAERDRLAAQARALLRLSEES